MPVSYTHLDVYKRQAMVYVGLGDHDQAMVWLNKAYEARFNPSILLRSGFDPLRSDSRFVDLRRRLGLQR